ncbi:MAG: SDR family oxidoreductase [Candidatus Heimdallarchaeota archaeon]
MNIVCTGNTRGIGLALTHEFLNHGDNVIISSRDGGRVSQVVDELGRSYLDSRIEGKACDVRNSEQVEKLGEFAKETLKSIDIWINNAGIRGPLNPMQETPVEQYYDVINTNLIGVLNGCKTALKIMLNQPNGGNIFNMAGMGSFGRATPRMAAYGASKAGIPVLTKSLVEENRKTPVGIHVLSPGMVISDFAGKNVTPEAARIYNILGDLPETVAKVLVPQIRIIQGTGKTIRYLTRRRAMIRFLTARRRKNRFYETD